MLQVFSEKKDLVLPSSTTGDFIEIDNDEAPKADEKFGLSTPSPPTRDPLSLFDGTEFAKSTEMTAQEFSNELNFTQDEFNVNLNSFLDEFFVTEDPLLGNSPSDLSDLCLKSDAVFSQLSVDGSMSKTNNLNTPEIRMEQPVYTQEEVVVDEGEYDQESEEASSSSATSPVQLAPQQPQPFHQQQQQQPQPQLQHQQPRVMPFNNRLLRQAPPIQQSIAAAASVGRNVRLVNLNQRQPQQQPIRGSSSFSANSYSPPPTPGNSKSSNSRGAAYARQYRQKNREHVEELEAQNSRLVGENDRLRSAYEEARSENDKLSREISYLRSVLQNDSSIASILTAVACNAPGLKFQFPMAVLSGGTKEGTDQQQGQKRTVETRASSKRKIDEQHGGGQQTTSKRVKGNNEGGESSSNTAGGGPGVCLHVRDNMVSVEFCSQCSREARCVNGEQWKRQQQ